MNDRALTLKMLRQEYTSWDGLLAGLDEDQITNPRLPANLSIKDVVAHLGAWQQRSIARLEAALNQREPVLPPWPEMQEPETDEALDRMNAWIYETYRDKPWPEVYADWRAGFQRFLELCEAIPEKDLVDPGIYPWLEGYPLSIVLQGSYEHHHFEHLEPLLVWLRQNGTLNI